MTYRVTTLLGLVGVIAGWTALHGQKPASAGLRPRQRRPDAAAGILRRRSSPTTSATPATWRSPTTATSTSRSAPAPASPASRCSQATSMALRDTDGDGKMDQKERFGTSGATGMVLRNGYLYFATPTLGRALQAHPGTARAYRARPKWSSAASRTSAAIRTRTSPSTTRATST